MRSVSVIGPKATTATLGIVQLAGDLAGTANAPTVPGLTGKASSSRQIIAGTGLTGGGDLTADRTLTVTYGTTAGSSAQGNDSRITQTVPAAKGDLLAGSGAGTLTKLTVGAAGTILVPDTTQTSGLKWAANRAVALYTSSQSAIAVPAGIIGAIIDGGGGGGGGGSARRDAAGTVRCGGGGGGMGAYAFGIFLPASWFGATYDVTIGAGGSPGAAVSSGTANGNAGGTGGATTLVSNSNTLRFAGGSGGSGGTAGSGVGGAAGLPGGTTGGSASTSGAGGNPGTSSGYGGSGGAGGGITSGDVANAGGAGAAASAWNATTAPAGGVVGGANPSSGAIIYANRPGTSAGGGAASTTGTAQNGADGVGYCAGAGGGGAAVNNVGSTGAGGTGGPSFLQIQWLYA